jgi:hypothetical protein
MAINWAEVQKVLSPIKDYEDCCHRLSVSFGYPFVSRTFNFTMPQLVDYTERLLGGDSRRRYTDYLSQLLGILAELHQAGVENVLSLNAHVESRPHLERFTQHSGLDALNIISLLKYLIYWFIPGEKYLSGLVRPDPDINQTLQVLAGLGVRTNLQLLQTGLTPLGRRSLADQSGLPDELISNLVNRADLSRLPWASKATVSNLIGAGYASMAQLANAEPEKLYADFYTYGQSIGKNLKLGNEIENSYRIAKIVPALVQEE